MKGTFIFSNEAVNSGNFHSWLWKASKEERIEIAKQIASTVGTTDEEISYIDMANLQEMHKEERMWLAKKIASSVPYVRGYTGC